MRIAIEKVWNYPKAAVKDGLHGNVLLEWIVEKDGKVSSIKLIRSSGHEILDNNIVETLNRVSPFASLPKEWGHGRLPVRGEFKYILTKFGDSKTSDSQPPQK